MGPRSCKNHGHQNHLSALCLFLGVECSPYFHGHLVPLVELIVLHLEQGWQGRGQQVGHPPDFLPA